VIAVPVLLEVFAFLGIDDATAIIVAVGTAQASILMASLVAAVAHWRARTIDEALVRAWLPALMTGTALGLALALVAPARLLTDLFAAIAATLALSLASGERVALRPWRGLLARLPPAAVGVLASAAGVGGGTLSTPALSLFSFPLKQAISAGALFNVLVALPATVFFLGTTSRRRRGRPMRWAMWRCSAWRRCRCLRSLSRRSRRVGRAAPRSCRCACWCGPDLAVGQTGGSMFM
jgi:uncharacterized membrane protein YfcA